MHMLSSCSRCEQCPSALQSCPCPNQVLLTTTHLGLVMEYCPGGDLFEYVVKRRGLHEDEGTAYTSALMRMVTSVKTFTARWFFQQLMVAVDYLHKLVWCTASAARSIHL